MSRVLVVDDEFDITEVLKEVLEDDGYQVNSCSNGKEAIDYLKSHKIPDLVIVDVMMPFVSGYEVIRYIRTNESLKSLPVILMSAIPPTLEQKSIGWDLFLRKPFELATFSNAVKKSIKHE